MDVKRNREPALIAAPLWERGKDYERKMEKVQNIVDRRRDGSMYDGRTGDGNKLVKKPHGKDGYAGCG